MTVRKPKRMQDRFKFFPEEEPKPKERLLPENVEDELKILRLMTQGLLTAALLSFYEQKGIPREYAEALFNVELNHFEVAIRLAAKSRLKSFYDDILLCEKECMRVRNNVHTSHKFKRLDKDAISDLLKINEKLMGVEDDLMLSQIKKFDVWRDFFMKIPNKGLLGRMQKMFGNTSEAVYKSTRWFDNEFYESLVEFAVSLSRRKAREFGKHFVPEKDQKKLGALIEYSFDILKLALLLSPLMSGIAKDKETSEKILFDKRSQ